jgi:hypothetical protein
MHWNLANGRQNIIEPIIDRHQFELSFGFGTSFCLWVFFHKKQTTFLLGGEGQRAGEEGVSLMSIAKFIRVCGRWNTKGKMMSQRPLLNNFNAFH